MRLLPPKLRNLTSKNGETSSAASTTSTEIWEIGVPAKNSLYWSIVISYLISASDTEFSNYLKRITGSKTGIAEIKKRKCMSPGKIHTDALRKQLRTFNPFKNRFTVFHGISIEEVFRIFILRLNRKSASIRSKNDSWNYELKLKAAAQLLNCIIEVYFADEPNQEKLMYRTSAESSDFQPRIILFQYKDQAHKNRKQNINIFYFGMNVQDARFLKLKALAYVMKKAKISNECIEHVKQLMKEEEEESHGLSFLPSILKSKWISVLPYLYKSPYIALKLHEASFEMDPTAVKVNNLSSLYYASINTDIKYIRILYDYASNCQCLLDKSVRNTDETVLKTLVTLKTTLDDDIQQIEQIGTEQRSLNILKQYSQFLKYQFQTVSEIEFSKTSIGAGSEVHLRKEVVKSILEQYLKFFRFNLSKDNLSDASENVYPCESEIFDNYLQFSELYENTDNFACTIFFDNFYLLKKNLGVKYESLTSSIEMKIFFVILSNKYFLQYETVCDKEEGEGNQNVLTHIPLYHRNVLGEEIKTFVNYLKSERDLRNIKNILGVKNDLGRYCPEIVDELMMTRLQKYITAALDVSPRDDGIKAVLAIEKALQVIGESIKPPSSPDRISSHFLRSCLPRSLQTELINIRIALSHNRNNIVQGKLNLEEDLEFWDDIRAEISKMRDAFEIVGKTQSHRTMEFLMNSAMTEVMGETLKQDIIKVFNQKLYNKSEKEREINNRYHTKYSNLLLNVIKNLLEDIKEAELYEKYQGKSSQREIAIPEILKPPQEILKDTKLQEQERQNEVKLKRTDTPGTTTASDGPVSNNFILGSIKAIKYLMNYLYKQTSNEDYNILLIDVKKLTCDIDDTPLSEIYLNRLNLLISKCTDKLSKSSEEFASYPKTESIYNTMSKNQFTGEDLDQIISAVNEAYAESEEAKYILKTHITNSHILTEEEIEELLIKIILRCDLSKLRDSLKMSNVEEFLNEYSIPFKTLVSDVLEMMSKNHVKACGAKALLTKIAFQKYLTNKIYLKVSLPTILCTKLEEFLMRKITYLLNRLRALKRILIEGDEEIKRAWTWGRSHAMKYHMKFLMRQRYMREMTFRAPLETVFFDCLNMLTMKNFEELREKPDKLFTGVDLRHVISHMSLFDVIGGILDEDDFPSAIITKMMELIEDTKAIKSMSELFRKCNTLEKERFKACIENSDYNHDLVNKIKKRNWQRYLILFPWL